MKSHFRHLSAFLLAGTLATLTACTTVGPADNLTVSSGTFTILREALTAPVSELNSRADKGEARAQFSLSLVYLYGLRNVPINVETAKSFRQKALARRGYTPITQYIPGINGKPGRTTIINVPRTDIGVYEAQINQTCAMALNVGEDKPEAFVSCGNENAYREFKSLWVQAKG